MAVSCLFPKTHKEGADGPYEVILEYDILFGDGRPVEQQFVVSIDSVQEYNTLDSLGNPGNERSPYFLPELT